MKKLLTLLFGNLGLVISAVLMSVISWFLMPICIEIIKGGHSLSNIIGWLFVCPFAIGFFLSAVFSSLGLIWKGARSKKWLWLISGALVLVFDIVLLVVNLV